MLRAGWTGPDCSQRLCPHGISFANVQTNRQGLLGEDAGRVHLLKAGSTSKPVLKVVMPLRLGIDRDISVEVEVVDVTGVGQGLLRYRVPGIVGDMQQLHAFDKPSGALMSPGNALEVVAAFHTRQQRTGVLVHVDGDAVTAKDDMAPGDLYFFNLTANMGGHYIPGLHGTMHQPVECSGAGRCIRSTGRCECAPGFTGDACARIACSKGCSGHGVCQATRKLLEDAGLSYNDAFDSSMMMSCVCDSGYRGFDCAMRECPSGPDPLGGPGGAEGRDCSGRGVCDYTNGVCQCAAGFFGSRCESRTNYV